MPVYRRLTVGSFERRLIRHRVLADAVTGLQCERTDTISGCPLLLGRGGLDLINEVEGLVLSTPHPVPEAGFGKLTVVSVELIDQFVKPVSHTVSCLPSDGIPYSFVSQAV